MAPRAPVASVADVVEWLETGHWTLGVIGLGYVGLPLAVTGAERGLSVVGFDVDEQHVARLSRGSSHVEDVTDQRLQRGLAAGAVTFTTDEADLAAADMLIIAVPSPLTRDRQPNMNYIQAAVETIETVLRPGQLVSLESTTYPGTTEDYLLPVLERRELQLDTDVWLCFSPERVDPGNKLQTGDIPKVVGGVTAASGQVATAAYRRLVDRVHLVSSARTAELTKLLENTYRAVNIALVNELAQFAHAVDIDMWEVVDAAATKPFGYQPFYPGPGVGGHCIPLDPQFLAWRARSLRVATRFIDLAEDINIHMPEYVLARVGELLNRHGMTLSGADVLAVGTAYKPNIGDDRESPAYDVIELLVGRGAKVRVFDPHVSDTALAARSLETVTDLPASPRPDLALVLTDHDAVDWAGVAEHAQLVFDTRGRYGRKDTPRPDNVEML